MKDLCTHARATMNLMLLLFLLQLWVLRPSESSKVAVEGNIVTMYYSMMGIPKGIPLTRAAEDFNQAFEAHASDPDGMPLSAIIALQESDFLGKRTFPEMPTDGGKSLEEYEKTFAASRNKGADVGGTALKRLIELIRRNDLASGTVADLDRKLVREVEVPFIKEPVQKTEALVILGYAELVLLIVMYSLLDTLWLTLKGWPAKEKRDFLDLILLYRSFWAVVVGFIWLSAPTLVSLIGVVSMAMDYRMLREQSIRNSAWVLALGLVIGVPVLLGAWSKVIKIRPNAFEPVQESGAKDDGDDDDDEGDDG